MIDKIIKIINHCDGKDIYKINVSKKLIIIDYIIICTGLSLNHNKFILEKICKNFKNFTFLKKEFDPLYEWIIIDIDNIIVNIMSKDIRLVYNLEELWNKK